MKTRIALVTGAAGFIGSHLCERLIADGWRVRGVDCFTTYYDPRLKERNLADLAREPRFELVRSDLREANLTEFLREAEVVWHLAAQAGVRASWGASFDEYTSININLTQRLFEAALAAPPKAIVFASSSSVYGEAPAFPAPEDGPLRPISPYGVTKLAGEHLARLYSRVHGLPIVSLRYFTVYGPRQRPDMAFHRFLKGILRGDALPVFGDGRQTRDFTYVADVVDATVRAAEGGEPGESYNVSGGSRVQLLEVIRILEAVTGCAAKLDHHPKQKGDPSDTGGDSSKARERFGYHPGVGLEEGLGRMTAWMRELLEESPV